MTQYSVCFDFDGTLIDSSHDITTAVNAVRDDRGLDPLDREDVVEAISTGTRETLRDLIPTDDSTDLDQFIIEFRSVYEEVCDEAVRPYEGIEGLIDELSVFNTGIVTNKPLSMTHRIVRKLDWDDHFSPVYGADSFEEKKPSVRPLRAVLEEWAIDPEELVMVGDSWVDVRAGNRAGVLTVGCRYGFGDESRMLEEYPDHVVETVEDLADLLASLNSR